MKYPKENNLYTKEALEAPAQPAAEEEQERQFWLDAKYADAPYESER